MGPRGIPRPVAIGIAVLISVVWAASQLGTLIVPDYQAPDAIHAALMIVLGFVFALKRSDSDEDDDGDDDEPPPRRRLPAAREDQNPPPPDDPPPPAGAIPVAELLARYAAEPRQGGRRRDR